jgi:hypothetical protein
MLIDRCHCALFLHDRIGHFCSESVWNIGDVFSHPPPHRESTIELELELAANGFSDTLLTDDGKHIGCLVQEKLEHPRHRSIIEQFGEAGQLTYHEMLALICYTSTEAYSDLRRSAAVKNWDRWPSFTNSLISALRTLQEFDMSNVEPSAPLFHGIANARPEGKHGGKSHQFWLKFMLPLSTSPDRAVALSFAGARLNGVTTDSLLLRFESPFRDEALGNSLTYFADVSWVSKFPSEQEVLIFPVGDCMGGRLVGSFRHHNCTIREFSAGFSSDW